MNSQEVNPRLPSPGINPDCRRFTDEVLSDDLAAILATKTPAERLEMAFAMWRFAQGVIERTARLQRPEWSESELRTHVAGRMSHGPY